MWAENLRFRQPNLIEGKCMTGFEVFQGTWKQKTSENFEEYMKAAGVGFLVRKAASHVTVTLQLSHDGKRFNCKQMSTFKNTELSFELDVEFVETTPDGRKFLTTVTFKDGKMVQHQRPIKNDQVESIITRWVEGDRLFVRMEAGGVTCNRTYLREGRA